MCIHVKNSFRMDSNISNCRLWKRKESQQKYDYSIRPCHMKTLTFFFIKNDPQSEAGDTAEVRFTSSVNVVWALSQFYIQQIAETVTLLCRLGGGNTSESLSFTQNKLTEKSCWSVKLQHQLLQGFSQHTHTQRGKHKREAISLMQYKMKYSILQRFRGGKNI